MNEPAAPPPVAPSPRHLQARFLSILAKIQTHARIFFRHVRCRCKRDDFIAETIALAWKWFRRLAEKGKDAREFASVLASFAARAVRCGRRVTGQLKPKDVLNERRPAAPRLLASGKLPDFSTLGDQPAGRGPDRQHPLAGTRAGDVPPRLPCVAPHPHRPRPPDHQRHGNGPANPRFVEEVRHFSPGRISQLRREFHDDWQRFCGEFSDN